MKRLNIFHTLFGQATNINLYKFLQVHSYKIYLGMKKLLNNLSIKQLSNNSHNRVYLVDSKHNKNLQICLAIIQQCLKMI